MSFASMKRVHKAQWVSKDSMIGKGREEEEREKEKKNETGEREVKQLTAATAVETRKKGMN